MMSRLIQWLMARVMFNLIALLITYKNLPSPHKHGSTADALNKVLNQVLSIQEGSKRDLEVVRIRILESFIIWDELWFLLEKNRCKCWPR